MVRAVAFSRPWRRKSRANPLQLFLPLPAGLVWFDPAAAPARPARPPRKNRRGSRPGAGRLRFGHQSPEEMARYVRTAYSERLDLLFRDSKTFLRDVLEQVEMAEQLAAAFDTGDVEVAKEAAGRLRAARERLAACGVSPGAYGLLDALQWGLFPELHRPEFEDEFAIRERMDQVIREKVARGEKKRDMVVRPAHPCRCCGRLDPKPVKLCPGGCGAAAAKPPQPGGVVPKNGGERIGSARVAALAGTLKAG
jgi:hypothetical protein